MRARPTSVLAFGVAVGVVGAGTVRYRRDLDAAERRLATVDRRLVSTGFGEVEYAERGTGSPLLLSHGIFHGCDGGLISVGDTVVARRVIVPSRFGYLGSSLPDGASAADQAEAFVALLDHLGLPRTGARVGRCARWHRGRRTEARSGATKTGTRCAFWPSRRPRAYPRRCAAGRLGRDGGVHVDRPDRDAA